MKPFKLSGPALEVLSIMAYKQPIVKSEVDHIRGVESGHLVRALMDKGLVHFQGKSELPGKPMQYGTTRKFLEIFGLRNLKELPSLEEIDQLLPDGIGMEEEDETLSQVTASMSEDFQGSYSENEDELEKISDKLGAIDTSSEFFIQEKVRQREKRDRDRARDLREQNDLGEDVSDKDQKWLVRYETQLVEAAAAKAAAEAEEEAAAGIDEVPQSELNSDTSDNMSPSDAADVDVEGAESEMSQTSSSDSLNEEIVEPSDDEIVFSLAEPEASSDDHDEESEFSEVEDPSIV